MMKNLKHLVAILLVTSSATVWANDIYITQVGDNLDLDIVQDGQDNQIGDSTTAMTLTGDSMTFSITQTGNYNDIAAVIKGTTYSGTWDFTGDSNTVDLTCDSTSGVNCESVTVDIDTTGDSNLFQLYIGESADTDSLVADFTVTGDGNIIDANINGTNQNITVSINNSASLSSATITGSAGTTTAPGNYLDIDTSGNGDVNGHTIDLTITGGGGNFVINQSGINDNTVNASFDGDGNDVNITQSD